MCVYMDICERRASHASHAFSSLSTSSSSWLWNYDWLTFFPIRVERDLGSPVFGVGGSPHLGVQKERDGSDDQ